MSGAFTAPVVDADPDAPLPWMATLYVPGRTLSPRRIAPIQPPRESGDPAFAPATAWH